MVDTIKISALPAELAPTSNDVVPMVDNDTGTTKQVAFDEFGKAINYTNSLSTDANNLLAVDGSNKLNLTASGELVSADASNTISVGSDGKLYGSATALTLNENELFVGNASNQPVSTSANDVRQILGLPTDYINDNIQYVSANQVSWEGKCRDSSDVRDFEIVGATTASLVGAAADTQYNLFVAGNTLSDSPVVVWDIGSTPAGYIYYRRVLSIITDGVGNIIQFTASPLDGGGITVLYDNLITDRGASLGANVTTDVVLSIPDSIDIYPIVTARLVRTGSSTSTCFMGMQGTPKQVVTGTVSNTSTTETTQITFLKTSNATISIRAEGQSADFYNVDISGFVDKRR